MLKVDTIAPDFEIQLASGNRFKLSEHRGEHVVLFFFPRAFTRG